MKILITAGPTREMLDDVRYLSNPASGQIGILIAEKLAAKSHDTTLILGPTHLKPKETRKLNVVNVISAEDMYNAVRDEFDDCDVFIATAAVADYKPKKRVTGKFKKRSDMLNLELVRTPDILKDMGAFKNNQLIIGFALEVQDALQNAHTKMLEKNCDYIVLNSPENFGESGKSKIFIINKEGVYKKYEKLSKNEQATEIIKIITN